MLSHSSRLKIRIYQRAIGPERHSVISKTLLATFASPFPTVRNDDTQSPLFSDTLGRFESSTFSSPRIRLHPLPFFQRKRQSKWRFPDLAFTTEYVAECTHSPFFAHYWTIWSSVFSDEE
jgi:hypothetical protein